MSDICVSRIGRALASVTFAALATVASTGQAAEATGSAAPRAGLTFAARPDPDAIPLYGAQTPGADASENWMCTPQVGCAVRNVTRPTITPVLPDRRTANGAAAIVLPGGGFMSLAIDHEGFRVARALAARGIAAFVLKYRLFPTPAGQREAGLMMAQRMKDAFTSPAGPASLFHPEALADARAALALVRGEAERWHVDPARVGMIGFSAGARTTLRVVLDGPAAERPRFFGYVYGDMSAKVVPADAPPMFAAIAFDDNLYPKGNVALAQAWHAAKRPVELHVYQKGGHGFGTGVPGWTNGLLIDQFTTWLSMQGLLKPMDKH